MQSSKVLEMIMQNRIDELIKLLKDDIYASSLRNIPNAKKRYLSMKRYLKTVGQSRPILANPCEITFNDKKYNALCNTYSLALTTESCGEIEMCSDPDRYPDVSKLIRMSGEKDHLDFNKIIAEAKTHGYKYTKSSIDKNKYLMHYKDNYYRIPLLEVTYRIIADGKDAVVYHNGHNNPLTFETDFGIGLILPVRINTSDMEENIVIEI